MATHLRCWWCNRRIGPRDLFAGDGPVLFCLSQGGDENDRCGDHFVTIMESRSIEKRRKPPRPKTVHVPCD